MEGKKINGKQNCCDIDKLKLDNNETNNREKRLSVKHWINIWHALTY